MSTQQPTDYSELKKSLCEKHGISVELFDAMLDEERRIRHLERRRGVTGRLRQMIEQSLEKSK